MWPSARSVSKPLPTREDLAPFGGGRFPDPDLSEVTVGQVVPQRSVACGKLFQFLDCRSVEPAPPGHDADNPACVRNIFQWVFS